MAAVPPASSTPVTATGTYAFKNVRMGGTGFVSGIVFSQARKDLAYARTDVGGAYRWNGATRAWTPLLDWVGWDDWGYQGVAAIAPSPTNANRVWAAVGMYTNGVDPNNGAVLRSGDKGATWQTTVLPFTLGGNMDGRTMGERLGVDPNNDDVLYLGAPTGNGLWRSTDGGATFAKVTSFPHTGDNPDTPGVTEDPGLVWVAFDRSSGTVGGATRTVYVGVADKSAPVYRSTDGGASWSPVAGAPTGFLPHKGVLDPVNHKLYIATSDTTGPFSGGKGDVWKLDTTTGAWTRISPIPSTSGDDYFGYSGLTVDRTHPDTIMVGTQV
ncbi:MAG: sialidase family protein, partial [Umezawaea sp.]